jgi:hypothetical protein
MDQIRRNGCKFTPLKSAKVAEISTGSINPSFSVFVNVLATNAI